MVASASHIAFSLSCPVPPAGGRMRTESTCTLRRTAWFGTVRAPRRCITNCRLPTMVFGGGGFLGVGPQEVLVIAAVGWFVLGPKQLLELSRDVGKIVGEVKKSANQARDTFTEALETDIAIMDEYEKRPVVAGPMPEGVDTLPELPDDESDDFFADSAPFSGENMAPGAVEDIAVGPSVKFLEQLNRVNDPNQISDADIPDLDMNEEDKVARLEQQLWEAKKRLEEKKKDPKEMPSSAHVQTSTNADESQAAPS